MVTNGGISCFCIHKRSDITHRGLTVDLGKVWKRWRWLLLKKVCANKIKYTVVKLIPLATQTWISAIAIHLWLLLVVQKVLYVRHFVMDGDEVLHVHLSAHFYPKTRQIHNHVPYIIKLNTMCIRRLDLTFDLHVHV